MLALINGGPINKLLRSATATALLLGAVIAADLPSRKAVIAPLPPPPILSGFYAGRIWTNSNPAFVGASNSNVFWLSQNSVVNSNNNGGFIGGQQIGCNWQIAGFGNKNIVAGIEADIQGVVASDGGRVPNLIWPGPYAGVNGSANPAWNNGNASSSL